jgi:leucyl-tRNA synthetase
MIYCKKCGWIPVSEDKLPVKLPEVKNYEPTDTGESPLAAIQDWVDVDCPKCGEKAKRETDTMPNWAGSSWYFLRYIDPKNDSEFADRKKLKYWMPIDLYNGGMEHTTLHLLYSRFWNKFLYEIGAVPASEPYAKRVSHGMVLANDNRKMSKSFGNVINPDEIVNDSENGGADTLRMYEMFMGPFGEAIPWNENGVRGLRRFLEKVWRVYNEKELSDCEGGCKGISKELPKILHKTIKKVTEDIDNFDFNTAISQMMIFINEALRCEKLSIEAMKKFLIILSPFAPHVTEELWEKLGNKSSIFKEKWPEYDEKFIKEDSFDLIIQISGKVRDKIKAKIGISENEALELAKSSEKIKSYIDDKEIIKVIIVKDRLLNIVVK